MKIIVKVFIIIIFATLLSCEKDKIKIERHCDDYYPLLDKVVEQKKVELLEYIEIIEEKMNKIRDDGPLINSFQLLSRLNDAKAGGEIPNRNVMDFTEQEKIIRNRYMQQFIIFDNIYFINPKGDVFYSLIKEPPLTENIFDLKYQNTKLSENLKQNTDDYVVDFNIAINSEPAAYFIYPVKENTKHLGWCIFQFDLRRLDLIFSDNINLGRTGEVFLVNENNYMLTDSFLVPEPSNLKLHLSIDNISRKFEMGKGRLTITDYRGYQAMTSFEVISYKKIKWLIVAKIDRDEVITDIFRKDTETIYADIRQKIYKRDIDVLTGVSMPRSDNIVKMDQYKRISKSGDLYTHGVSACSAVVITLPGEFSYMAHISPYDVLYDGKNTDIIGNIINRIKKYEIPDYRLRELEFFIITPQIQFTQNVLKNLTDQKILLSQIHILKNPDAKLANIYHSLNDHCLLVEWMLLNGKTVLENACDVLSTQDYIQQ